MTKNLEINLHPDLKTHRSQIAHSAAWQAVRHTLILAGFDSWDPDNLRVSHAEIDESGSITFHFSLTGGK